MPGNNHLARLDVESLLHPYTNLRLHERAGPLIIERGEGIYLFDDQGRRYIDAFAGLWCATLGHGNAELIEAATRQMRKVAFTHTFSHRSNEPAILLADRLKALAPHKAGKVLFASSGSEANDMQIKLAWYAANARGEPRRKKIISRKRAYHGVTIAAASLTGLPFVQNAFDLPVNERFLYARAPYYYREAEAGETQQEFSRRLARELRELIEREGPQTIAAFIAEPVMGAGGVIVPPEGYFEAIMPVLREHGIRVISDEVICGFGRTGSWFGCQTFHFEPDSITVAKALSAAYVPLSAITIDEDTYEAMKAESDRQGMFGHGFTYTGHPVACAVALKALRIYERDDIPGHARRLAPLFERHFRALAQHPLVGDVRVAGLMGAIELVADKKTKQPFDPSLKMGARLDAFCREEGLLARAMAGDNLALCPPLIVSADDVEEIFALLRRALDKLADEAKREGLI